MIWRSEPLDDSFDLTAGLNFFPPKGSAELDEALHFWFPLSQTPQERRRDAVIAFLNEEKANSSSEVSGPLSSTELDNGTQGLTSATTTSHSHESGPHQSPPTDTIYGPINGCLYHIIPPPTPLEDDVHTDYIGPIRRCFRVQQTFPSLSLLDEGYIPRARRSGTPSDALPLLETPDYRTIMGATPSGSTERTDCYPISLGQVNRVTRARFVQDGYQCKHGDCLKTFHRACDLRHHARKHIAPHDRPFVCLDCGKRFLWQKDLSRHHKQVHTRLGKRPYARLPRRSHVCGNCGGFSHVSDLSRHQSCLHDRYSVRVDDDISQLSRRNDPSHQQGSTPIASRDRPFPYGHSGKPLLWEKHMSQALRQTTKTSLRRLDSTPDMHGSIPELSIASRLEPFRIQGLLVVLVSSPGIWMVESVALLLCFVFGVTYPGFVEQFLEVRATSLS